MVQIKTQELRDAAQAAYEFDKEHGKCTDESTGQFTGNFYHEPYIVTGKQIGRASCRERVSSPV